MEKSKKASNNRLSAYIQKSCNLALKAVLWAGVCFALNIGLLYFVQMLIGFYLKTAMAPDFIASNREFMDTLAQMSAMGFEQLSIPLVLTAIFTSLGILAVCKFFFLARYISPMGIIGRVIFCVLPISGVVAVLIPEYIPVGGWEMAYALSVFPTFAMFNICFTIADELLPEVNELTSLFQKNDNSGKRFNGRR
jgi:hypothetical protein